MFLKLNLHLFRRKKIENRLKNDRFIEFLGFLIEIRKWILFLASFCDYPYKTKILDKSVIFQAIFDFFSSK